MPSRAFIIFHGRFPSEKAAALYAAEHAKSLAAHVPVTIIVPRRFGRDTSSPHEQYALPSSVQIRYLPTLDLFWTPLRRAAFGISYAAFSLAAFTYLLFRLREKDIVDTNEALPALMVTVLPSRVVYEVHDFPEKASWLYRTLLRRVRLVLATNAWKGAELTKRFGVSAQKVIVESNGVDLSQFSPRDRTEARRTLGLPQEARMAVYTGHLYGWKGVDTLAEAARLLPDVEVYVVGGTPEDLEQFRKRHAGVGTLHAVGHRPHAEMPLWQAAADVLVLPNTAKEEISAHYTSPMKLFEYMASGRPIAASRLPSIEEVLPEDAAFYFAPDNAEALAEALAAALMPEAVHTAAKAQRAVAAHSWEARARRILAVISSL